MLMLVLEDYGYPLFRKDSCHNELFCKKNEKTNIYYIG